MQQRQLNSRANNGKRANAEIICLTRSIFASVIFWALFISILIVFDPIQRICFCFSKSKQQQAVLLMNRSIVYALRFVGVRIKVTGEIPNNVSLPYIILANHQSLFDIPILHVLFARDLPRFVSKIELSKWIPSVSFNLRVGGNAIIDRSNPRQAISILKDFTRAMKDGRFPAVLFPEGTRARDGLLKSFRTSGTIAMLKDLPEAIVLPVMLDGGWRLSKSKTGLMPLPAEVNVVIGKPFGRDNKTEAELINESYNFILKSLIENRGTNNVTAVTANKCPNNENLAA